MGAGEGDADWDKIKIEQGDLNVSASVIQAMITTLKAARDAGALTQDDMVSLLQNWIKVDAHFQRGGEGSRLGRLGGVKDARTEAIRAAYAKGGLLSDLKADPDAQLMVQSPEDVDNPDAPKPSVALNKSLNNLMNYVRNDHEWQRMMAFRDAQGAFTVLYWNYRIKLAANRGNEQHFRNMIARLRNGHTIK
jgi:hypothetical protein